MVQNEATAMSYTQQDRLPSLLPPTALIVNLPIRTQPHVCHHHAQSLPHLLLIKTVVHGHALEGLSPPLHVPYAQHQASRQQKYDKAVALAGACFWLTTTSLSSQTSLACRICTPWIWLATT